jgi:hypothetical protein
MHVLIIGRLEMLELTFVFDQSPEVLVPIVYLTNETFDGLDINHFQGFTLAIAQCAKFASLLLVQELAQKDQGEQEGAGVLRGHASTGAGSMKIKYWTCP